MICIAELQIIMNAFDGPQIGETIEELNMQIEKWTRSIGKHIFAVEILNILNNATEVIASKVIASKVIGNDSVNNTRKSTKRKIKNDDDDEDD